MKSKLKVFCGATVVGRTQYACIMATTRSRDFEQATGCGREFYSKTGNADAIRAATTQPGEVLYNLNGMNYPRVWVTKDQIGEK